MGPIEHTGQLKNTVKSPMTKPLASFVLYDIVIANQHFHSIHDSHLELSPRLLCLNDGGNSWHWHEDLRQRSSFLLHFETKFFTERPQTASEKFLNSIVTSDDISHLDKSSNVSVVWTVGRQSIGQMSQWSHCRTQWIALLAMTIACLLSKHSTVEPVTILATRPPVPHSRGKFHTIPKPRGVKRDAAKLGSESLRPLEMNFLVLIV
jgi:hypothetical protein